MLSGKFEMIISHATVIWRKRNTPVISIHRYLVNKRYPLFKFVSPSVNCSFRKSIFTTNTFQGIQYFNSFSISVVLDFYIRSLFNGSERGHCASNTSARRDVTIDDVIIRTPDVMCEWLTRRTRYIPNFICLACKLIAL